MNKRLQQLRRKTQLSTVKRKVGKFMFEVELLHDDVTFEVRADMEQFRTDGVASPAEIEAAFDDFFDHVIRKTNAKLDIGRMYGNAEIAYCKFRFETGSLLQQI
jgi:hypothetical protein